MHVHAEHNAVKFDCGFCFKEFKRKGSLDRHISGVHKNVRKNSKRLVLMYLKNSKQHSFNSFRTQVFLNVMFVLKNSSKSPI